MIAAIEKIDGPRFLKRHSGRITDRMFGRFDLDENGQGALSEVENRTLKFFALADYNDDGKVVIEELRKLRGDRGHRRGHRWGRGSWSGDQSNGTQAE